MAADRSEEHAFQLRAGAGRNISTSVARCGAAGAALPPGAAGYPRVSDATGGCRLRVVDPVDADRFEMLGACPRIR